MHQMRVRDLIKLDIDIDVVDDVCEKLYVGFSGPMALTDDGMDRFGEVMSYPVDVDVNNGHLVAIVRVDGDGWRDRLELATKFFNAIAGYCSEENYKKWFKELDD